MIVIGGFQELALNINDEFYWNNKDKIRWGSELLSVLKIFYKIDIKPEDDVYVNGISIQKGEGG